MFWALLADYPVKTLAAKYLDGLVCPGTVAVLAAATGVLQLTVTVTVTVWGRAWTAVTAPLAGPPPYTGSSPGCSPPRWHTAVVVTSVLPARLGTELRLGGLSEDELAAVLPDLAPGARHGVWLASGGLPGVARSLAAELAASGGDLDPLVHLALTAPSQADAFVSTARARQVGDDDVAGRRGMPVAAPHGVRPPVRQFIRKVAVVHCPIRTCERSSHLAR